MPRRNKVLIRLMNELANTASPAKDILKRLGVSPGRANRLLKSQQFRVAVTRLNRRLATCRELDLARAASLAAHNVLCRLQEPGEEKNSAAKAQVLSATAVRLIQAEERLVLSRKRTGTNRNERPVRRDPYLDVDPQALAELEAAQADGPNK